MASPSPLPSSPTPSSPSPLPAASQAPRSPAPASPAPPPTTPVGSPSPATRTAAPSPAAPEPPADRGDTSALPPSLTTPSPPTRTGPAQVLLASLVDRLASRLRGGADRVVVGLAGAPGSGKSTLADRLGGLLAGRGLLAGSVPMDGFHMSNAVLAALGRHGRKGAPDTFDIAGYLCVLDRIRSSDHPEVLAPVYRRDLHEPVAAGTRVTGPGVVITEGNYLALDSCGWEEVRPRVDLLVFLEVPEDELVTRLVARHRDFGRSAADAGHWVRAVDLPNARLVTASAHRCDEIWGPTAP